jgi:hypothetical protein
MGILASNFVVYTSIDRLKLRGQFRRGMARVAHLVRALAVTGPVTVQLVKE